MAGIARDPVDGERATLIVAIDFGTSFSGFSYVHRRFAEEDPAGIINHVEGFEQWPFQREAGCKPYCKTQTSLLYVRKETRPGDYELKGYGWEAFHEHLKLRRQAKDDERASLFFPSGTQRGAHKSFHFVQNFKLALAGKAYGDDLRSYELPKGFQVEGLVADYLHEFSILIEKELRAKYGKHISKKSIQWCLTVPAIWDDKAKQQMKRCAEIAGLVAGPLNVHGGGSPHPIIIVLEPEAASVYCLHYVKKTHKTDVPAGSKILIVDAGGGTVDLVFHERMDSGDSSLQVKEICSGSSGGLCGATLVDVAFFKFLAQKITCFEMFIKEYPVGLELIRSPWESLKFSFDGASESYELALPAKLSNYWERHNQKNGLHEPDSYDEVTISLEELKSVFDYAVNKVLALIKHQVDQVKPKDLHTIMVVGGFSGSAYLMDRIQTNFAMEGRQIINPTHPGRAVVTGAVVYGALGSAIIVSRVSRKTYGIRMCRYFCETDPISYLIVDCLGHRRCRNFFKVYTRKGDVVPVNHCVKSTCSATLLEPGDEKQIISVNMYSSTNPDPAFTTDEDCVQESTFSFQIPTLEKKEIPEIEISMHFGGTTIEVTAVGMNFECEETICAKVTFETV